MDQAARPGRAESDIRGVGFNPCCLGSGCSAASGNSLSAPAVGFQSLLSWIRLLGDTRDCDRGKGVSILVVLDQAARPAAVVRFECKFDVSILVVLDQAARPVRRLTNTSRDVFQSLLSWIRLLGSGTAALALLHLQFQSLLSWIRLLGRPRPDFCAGCVFQSLLSWIRLLGSGGAVASTSERPVSILVVLDQAARPYLSRRVL